MASSRLASGLPGRSPLLVFALAAAPFAAFACDLVQKKDPTGDVPPATTVVPTTLTAPTVTPPAAATGTAPMAPLTPLSGPGAAAPHPVGSGKPIADAGHLTADASATAPAFGFPAGFPTALPSGFPTALPSGFPTALPSGFPSALPSGFPTALPSSFPTMPGMPAADAGAVTK